MEKHFAFIKDQRVILIAVFDHENTALAETIKTEKGFDSFVWLNDTQPPQLYSLYDGKKFLAPTEDYLVSIGLTRPTIEQAVAE